MKHRYRARVIVEGSTEETIFEPMGEAPRLPARYRTDRDEFGKFRMGREYLLDPEKVEEAVEQEIAEVQIEAAKESVAAMKPPKGKK